MRDQHCKPASKIVWNTARCFKLVVSQRRQLRLVGHAHAAHPIVGNCSRHTSHCCTVRKERQARLPFWRHWGRPKPQRVKLRQISMLCLNASINNSNDDSAPCPARLPRASRVDIVPCPRMAERSSRKRTVVVQVPLQRIHGIDAIDNMRSRNVGLRHASSTQQTTSATASGVHSPLLSLGSSATTPATTAARRCARASVADASERTKYVTAPIAATSSTPSSSQSAATRPRATAVISTASVAVLVRCTGHMDCASRNACVPARCGASVLADSVHSRSSAATPRATPTMAAGV